MNTRISDIRKAEKMTQERFAEKLGLSRNYVNLLESGKKTPGERLIKDICEEFNVNEKWLRTGEGEPRIPLTRKQAIADFMADCLKDEEDSFRSGLIEALAELSVDEWEVLEKIATTAIKNKLPKKD